MGTTETSSERRWQVVGAPGEVKPQGELPDFGAAGGGSTIANQGGTGTYPIDGEGKKPPQASDPPADAKENQG